MKSLIILGGTGIIGGATAKLAIECGFDVTVTGIEENPSLLDKVNFVPIDEIPDKKWDAVFEIYTFGINQQEIYERFEHCNHLFILSTTLVYDRSKYSTQRIKSTHPLALPRSQGAYVDHKLELEHFWTKQDLNWTILRPYHILGANSYLGCLPPHNRDPNLVSEIKKGEIELCDGGRVPLNVTHPADIGEFVLRAFRNSNTFQKAYNVVNPTEIIARDYFLKIAARLGVDLRIKNKPGEKCWSKDWQLTILPHMYDVSDLCEDVGFVPGIDLNSCISDALNSNLDCGVRKEETEVYGRMNELPLVGGHGYY